jgi:hypothetical protein
MLFCLPLPGCLATLTWISWIHLPINQCLKINIVDPLQNLVPLFTGELNFIASTYPAYWYLYVHFSKFGKRQLWPFLIDGEDISRLSKLIEEVYSQTSPHTGRRIVWAGK